MIFGAPDAVGFRTKCRRCTLDAAMQTACHHSGRFMDLADEGSWQLLVRLPESVRERSAAIMRRSPDASADDPDWHGCCLTMSRHHCFCRRCMKQERRKTVQQESADLLRADPRNPERRWPVCCPTRQSGSCGPSYGCRACRRRDSCRYHPRSRCRLQHRTWPCE